ncbi:MULTISPECIES: NifU family protein [unclassified Thioalkalivibrio]|uniref:NifU family protein n=1 Tax=unclassified Thioalkalivibrio TaxID=2621013 RepID=UPI00037146E5|nr:MULTISPECIES: NifU family protein [unclassified Thioalkalivibrio]
MSRRSAPPLRLRLHPDPVLPRLAQAGQILLVLAVSGFVLVYSPLWMLLPVWGLAAVGWWWQRRDAAPDWAWLGQTPEGDTWVATREGLRQEQVTWVELLPDSRVLAGMVLLVLRERDGGRLWRLWLHAARMDPDDLRRLRVRLRWPPVATPESGWRVRLRAGWAWGVAILARMRSCGGPTMAGPDKAQVMVDVSHLLNDDPDHVYSEDELDAIEELDPELALRLDRAQTFAEREASDVPADGPIDEDAVRAAIEEARRILMQDGGDIEFVELDGRTVRVRLKGACVGCPRSTLDLKNVVERLVRSRAPGVASVANTF